MDTVASRLPLSSSSPAKRMVVFGAGYVGEAVCRLALNRGIKVTALTRNEEKGAQLTGLGVDVVVADLATASWHEAVPRTPDFVVNCVSSGGGGVTGYRHSYLDGARSILDWAGAQPLAATLVYTSSTSVYPQGDGVRVDETASTASPSNENAGVLLQAEGCYTAWPGRSFVLRLSGIYGPGRHHLLDQLRAGAAVLPGRGDHHLNLIHRDDIAAAIWTVLNAPTEIPGQVFNLSDDAPALKSEFAAWLAEKLGVSIPSFSGAATSGRRAVVPDRLIINERIKTVLGWRPRFPSFREGYASLLGA